MLPRTGNFNEYYEFEFACGFATEDLAIDAAQKWGTFNGQPAGLHIVKTNVKVTVESE